MTVGIAYAPEYGERYQNDADIQLFGDGHIELFC